MKHMFFAKIGGVTANLRVDDTTGALEYSTDGTEWASVPGVYGDATGSAAGLMSASDKSKLDSLVAGYLGYYATSTALTTAHETGTDGQFANVGETDTIWAWDSDTSAWVDTGSTTINPSWENITGKPDTFPPATHSHVTSDVTGLDTALAEKLTTPSGGTVDQVLKKTADGVEWGDSQGMTDDERARLLPETPTIGSMAVFEGVTIGGGNDSTTKLLIQPATSEAIVDSAAGNAAPVAVVNTGITVTSNAMSFDGSSHAKIPAGSLSSEVMTSAHEWTFDAIFMSSDERSPMCLFGIAEPRFDILYYANGNLSIGGMWDNFAVVPRGEKHLLTLEYWYNETASTWVLSAYIDGSFNASRNGTLGDYRAYTIYVGWEGYTGGRKFVGTIDCIRIRNTAPYKGSSFTPEVTPYTVPEASGAWVAKTTAEVVAMLPPAPWTTLDYAAAVTVPADAPQQKMTLTGNCTLTAPALTENQRVRLKISGTGQSLTLNGTTTTISGAQLLEWFHDGTEQYMLPVQVLS